jgi:ArsR family transcriptional regulator
METFPETDGERLAAQFKALGDPTRLRIFETLRGCARSVAVSLEPGEEGACRPAGALTVGEVCCELGASLSNISHHLRELRLAGLVRAERQGRWIYCSVNEEALEPLRSFLAPPREVPQQVEVGGR